MRVLLAIAISLWFGVAIGAIVESVYVVFWGFWLFVGVMLAIATLMYIRKRREREQLPAQ
jgi:uncharacterized membrane protein YfcA